MVVYAQNPVKLYDQLQRLEAAAEQQAGDAHPPLQFHNFVNGAAAEVAQRSLLCNTPGAPLHCRRTGVDIQAVEDMGRWKYAVAGAWSCANFIAARSYIWARVCGCTTADHVLRDIMHIRPINVEVSS